MNVTKDIQEKINDYVEDLSDKATRMQLCTCIAELIESDILQIKSLIQVTYVQSGEEL